MITRGCDAGFFEIRAVCKTALPKLARLYFNFGKVFAAGESFRFKYVALSMEAGNGVEPVEGAFCDNARIEDFRDV